MEPGGAGAVPGDLVEVGVVRGAYGLKGWAHVQPHSVDADALRRARRWWLQPPQDEAPAEAVQVTGLRAQGAGWVAKWQGCEDPESAQRWKGWRIAVSRAEFPRLPKGQYYWVDLIGARVVNRAGVELGTVQGLRNNGAHDLLEVEREPGTQTLIPMVAAYLDGVDVAQRRIRVDWQADW